MQLPMQVLLVFSLPQSFELSQLSQHQPPASATFFPEGLALTDAFPHSLPRPAARVESY